MTYGRFPLESEIQERLAAIQRIYDDPSVPAVQPLLRKYNIELIFVGELEQGHYKQEGLDKFDTPGGPFSKVFQSGRVSIYRAH